MWLEHFMSGVSARLASVLSDRAFAHLRWGHKALALDYARKAIGADRHHVRARAVEGLALQALGRFAEADAIFDYPTFLRIRKLVAPPPWRDACSWNQALVREILSRPDLVFGRPNVATYRGLQTGNILRDPSPALAALTDAVMNSLNDYLRELRSAGTGYFDSDRVLIRRAAAVVLPGGGHQREHVHDHGFLSGVYYAAVPPECCAGHSGHLAFGKDPGPRYGVRPQDGMLALFPSYFFHTTTPFSSRQPRISVAFDAVRNPHPPV